MTLVNGGGPQLRGLPSPTSGDGISSVLRALLPARLAEDIVAGEIHLELGVGPDRRELTVPVLASRPNSAWKEQFKSAFGQVLNDLSAHEDDASAVLALLSGMTDRQLDLLKAYDASSALPDADWIADHASDAQILQSFLAVTAAAFPLAVSLIEAVRANRDVQAWVRLAFLQSMSSLRPSGDGSPESSRTN